MRKDKSHLNIALFDHKTMNKGVQTHSINKVSGCCIHPVVVVLKAQ